MLHRVVLSFVILAVLAPPCPGQWERVNFPRQRVNVIHQTTQGLLAFSVHSVYRSKDNGLTWDSLGNVSGPVEEFLEVGNVLLCVSTFARIPEDTFQVPSAWRSVDGGRSWPSVMKSMYGSASIVRMGNTLYTHPDGELFSSADTGRTWTMVGLPGILPDLIAQLVTDGPDLYARIQNTWLFRSSNGGTTWDCLPINIPSGFYPVVVCNSSVYVGAFTGGFYVSTDRGNTWGTINAGLPDSSGFRNLMLVGDQLVASISRAWAHTVYRLSISRNRWEVFNSGLVLSPSDYIWDFTSNDSYIFLVAGSSMWRRPLADLMTDIEHDEDDTPAAFSLKQNFPNPFNPSTTIEYSVAGVGIQASGVSRVRLAVYDMLGREVAVLVDEQKAPGRYSAVFDAAGLPTGVYVYRLQAGDYVEAKRLVVVR